MFTNFFGRVKDPCEDCVGDECTMNCSGKERAGPSGDKGTLILTREDDGTVTVRARTPDAYAESKVNVPRSVWDEMVSTVSSHHQSQGE